MEENKGKLIEAFVEQVRDGSTLRVYLLPDFQFIQVFVAGIQVNAVQVEISTWPALVTLPVRLPFFLNKQAPTMGRRATSETVVNASITSDEPNGESTTEPRATPTTAQRLAASAASVSEVAPDPYGREAKHFTETRVLNRDVRFLLALNGLCFRFILFLI